jgi:hypothetical protein
MRPQNNLLQHHRCHAQLIRSTYSDFLEAFRKRRLTKTANSVAASTNPAGAKSHHRRPDQSGQAVYCKGSGSSIEYQIAFVTAHGAKFQEEGDRKKFGELRVLAAKAIEPKHFM